MTRVHELGSVDSKKEMSEKQSQTPFCEDHPDEDAIALCKYHKKLLCIGCVLVKAKSSECSITEIRKISDEQDTALYVGLLVRQIAINKKRSIDEHENKTEELKITLKKQITDFHEQLITSLNKTKDDCLSLLEKYAKTIGEQTQHRRQQLEPFVKEINEKLEAFSDESGFDPSGIQTKFNDIKKMLLEEVPDLDLVFEGNFEEDEYLKNKLSKSKFTIGKVYLIAQERYAQVGNETDLNAESKTEDAADKEGINDSVNHKLAAYATSDELIDIAPTELTERKQTPETNVASGGSSKKHRDINDKKQEPTCNAEESKKVKEVKKRAGLFARFRKKTSDSDKKEKDTETEEDCDSSAQSIAEEIYKVTSFDTIEKDQLRSLINQTVSIGGMQQHFKTACKFSKLVYLRSGYVGLFSRSHNSVVLTSIDGTFHAKKTIQGLSDIVACGKEQVATIKIVDKNLQVTKYSVGNKKIEASGSFTVNVDVPKVTGLDFDEASLKFAVSSTGKLAVFKDATTVKETKYPIQITAVSDDVVTAYDFINDCLYFLDSQNRKLKCFSFSRADYLWKIRIDDQRVPRNFCLFEDKLCVTNGKAVGLFHAKDGKAVLKHDTCDLLDDCDGICVIDGVIVFSSNSSDFDNSAKLAFISM